MKDQGLRTATYCAGRPRPCRIFATGPSARLAGCGRRFWTGLRTGLIALTLLTFPVVPTPKAEGLSEAQIKAAYLYNFAKFIEWPADTVAADATLTLCVVGNNVLEGALQALDGRKAGEHDLRIEVRGFADFNPAGCHLLFVGATEQPRFLVTLKAVGRAPVLTLSDIADFAEKGGGIALLFRDNKVVFEVNLESIRNAGLRLPGQLLNIATYVYGR
ncbi:YfiR family protein [Methylomonas sp. UP202]|uniref:YfiR family protein n=1 Tax=Methylomonas sp. UP202 TaxID=3040943 RepID=UPI0024799418|nr:YfiR family protein [Methylomonas sp. UP202]WGS85784.1 YfiR family protein [Methylomonas sp. UP202]